MSYITKNPKRSIGALATALAAVGVAVGSGATFTSQTSNLATSATAGTLVHTNSVDGAILEPGNMKPGDVETGSVTITNTGTLAGRLTLNEENATSTFDADVLILKVVDRASGEVLYNDDFEDVPAAGIPAGDFAVDQARTYDFTVTLDEAADDDNQGATAKADFVWNEVQL